MATTEFAVTATSIYKVSIDQLTKKLGRHPIAKLDYSVTNDKGNSIGIFAVTNDKPEFETGVTSYNLDLINRLSNRFPEMRFTIYLSPGNSRRFKNLESKNVEIEIVPNFNPIKNRALHLLFQKKAEWRFFSKIESLRNHKLIIYTVFGLFQYFPAYFFDRVSGRCISVIHDVRFVYQSGELFSNFIRKKLHYKIFDSIMKSSELILLPSAHCMENLNSLFPSDKYRVSYSVPERDEFLTASPILDRGVEPSFFFYFPATMVETKNHLVLINAMKIFVEYYPRARLILTGSNFESRLGETIKAAIKFAELEKNVIHLGFVSKAEKLWLFENAAAAIFPTKNESFNLGIWEAFACKCPVVTSTDPEMVEQVGNAGLVAEVDNALSLCRAMKLVVEKPDILERLVYLGEKRVTSVRAGALLSGWEARIDQ